MGVTCGANPDHRFDGVCDKDGCDLNAFRAGVKDFYGPGKTIDSGSPVTVVTQFYTDSNGDLSEIKRKYVQNGKVIEHPQSKVDTMSTQYNSLSDKMCSDVKTAFGDKNDFQNKGGMKQMGKAMKN